MKNNHKRDNSLFTLEKGLFSDKISEQQSHQPTEKKKKKPKQPREEARAFDLGEAIQLQYDGDAYPTHTPEAMSFSERNSFASELEDESLPFEVEAFEVDEEVVPVSKQVTPKPETSVKPEIKQEVNPKPEVQPVKATIVPASEQPKSDSPVKQPTTVEPTSPDESLPFEVEAFEVDKEVVPVSKQVTPKQETPVQPVIKQEVNPKPEVQPVKATIVPASEQPKSDSPVKQPTTVEPTSPKEKLSDAQEFAADLQAILNGEKTYDSQQKQVVSSSPPAQPPAAPTPHPHDIFDQGQAAIPPQKSAEPVQMSRSHAVFDQMGQNMAHATDFDQGTVDLALEQAFDEFDRILDKEENKSEVQEKPSVENLTPKLSESLETVSLKKRYELNHAIINTIENWKQENWEQVNKLPKNNIWVVRFFNKIEDVNSHQYKENERIKFQIGNIPEESETENIPEESQIDNVQEESKLDNIPEESKLDNIPEESETENIQEESKININEEDNQKKEKIIRAAFIHMTKGHLGYTSPFVSFTEDIETFLRYVTKQRDRDAAVNSIIVGKGSDLAELYDKEKHNKKNEELITPPAKFFGLFSIPSRIVTVKAEDAYKMAQSKNWIKEDADNLNHFLGEKEIVLYVPKTNVRQYLVGQFENPFYQIWVDKRIKNYPQEVNIWT